MNKALVCWIALAAGGVSGAEADPSAIPSPSASPAVAAEKERQEAVKRHIRPAAQWHAIATPPPPPRVETKPPAPAPDQVWKTGHWAVVDGAWKWTPGEWGTPPVPSSVWIEGKYDPKTQRWSPPYWQPDRPSPSEQEPTPPKQTAPSAEKF